MHVLTVKCKHHTATASLFSIKMKNQFQKQKITLGNLVETE